MPHIFLSENERHSPSIKLWKKTEEEDVISGFENVTQYTSLWSTLFSKPKGVPEDKSKKSTSLAEKARVKKHLPVFGICFTLILVSLSVAKASVCSLRPSTLNIAHEDCISRRVDTLSCYGTCNSYSSINPEDPTSVMRSCSCCQETGFVGTRIFLRCPIPGQENNVTLRGVYVRQPLTCSCRPCDPM